MRRVIFLLGLAMLANVSLVAALAHAGGHGHSGNHHHNNNSNNNKPPVTMGTQVATANKNTMGYIADPLRRPLNSVPLNNKPLNNLTTGNLNFPKGNFIADPYKPNTGTGTPVVRDHSLPNPNAIPPQAAQHGDQQRRVRCGLFHRCRWIRSRWQRVRFWFLGSRPSSPAG